MSAGTAEANADHLRAERLQHDLKERAVRSGAAVVAAQFGTALVALAAVAVLARLLQPSDFGLVAMTLPAMVIASGLRNFGLDFGAINRAELSATALDALFWLLLRLNVGITAVLAALGPVLAWFYGDTRVIGITLAFAAGILFVSAGAQHETLLKREMRFGVLSLINFAAALIGAICAIILALVGAGYWALVAQTVVMFLFRSALAWIACDWRPRWRRDRTNTDEVLRSLRSYGRDLTFTRVLILAGNYSDRVAVGWLAGSAVLGFYENARRIAFIALETLYTPLLDVAVAGLSRSADDDARYSASAFKAVQFVLAVLLPCLAFALVEIRAATLLFLGDKWEPAVPFARLLVLAAFAQSVTRTLMWFYLAESETARQLRWSAVQTLVTLGAVVLGALSVGAIGVASAVAAVSVGLAVPAVVYALRGSPFTAVDFIRAAARPVVLSLGAAAALSVVETWVAWPASPLMRCIIGGGLFSIVYVGGWVASPGGVASGRQMVRLASNALTRRRCAG